MGSQAGLNLVGSLGGVPMLAVTPSSVAVTLPAYGANANNVYVPGTSGYLPGLPNPVLGNDSGVFLTEAKGFTKWVFQLLGPGATAAGYTITILGTIDPQVQYSIDVSQQNPQTPSNLYGSRTSIPATNWFVIPGPSEQTGTGTMANPLVSGTTQIFQANLPLTAVRAVLTTIGTPTASAYVVAMAVP